jgi:hypothetical protein
MKPAPDELIASAIYALRTDTVPPDGGGLTSLQLATLLYAYALYEQLKAADANPYLLGIALKLIEAFVEARGGSLHPLFKPARVSKQRTPPRIIRLRAYAVVTLELIRASGKTYDEAADEVVAALASWMGDLAPKPATVIDWRRWIREQPERHPELVQLYKRAKGPIPGVQNLLERLAHFLTLISSSDVF